MEKSQCYCITTRRFTLQCGHEDWLRSTQNLYNEVILFYYQLFLEREKQEQGCLTSKTGQQILRELEVISVIGREKKPVPYPLPWGKVPLYFRRSAINSAIAAAKSHFTGKKTNPLAGEAKGFHKGVTYYKGMYRNLNSTSVNLKVWTGKGWQWVNCRLKGRELPDQAVWLSPTVTIMSWGACLMVPIKETVHDGRKASERMEAGSRICSIQFGAKDTLAAGVILGPDGRQEDVRFFGGGRQYAHQCQLILEKIIASEKAMGKDHLNKRLSSEETVTDLLKVEHYNQKYWMKLKHMNEYYAHRTSRQIVDYCREKGASIIVIPDYSEKYTQIVMNGSGNWTPVHLSRKIRSLLFYKAWQSNLVVLEVNPAGTSSKCSKCCASVRKKGSEYECLNGHRGNRQMNAAKNLGRKCLTGFGYQIAQEWLR